MNSVISEKKFYKKNCKYSLDRSLRKPQGNATTVWRRWFRPIPSSIRLLSIPLARYHGTSLSWHEAKWTQELTWSYLQFVFSKVCTGLCT